MVCGTSSWLIQVTVVPRGTSIDWGENEKLSIDTLSGSDAGVAPRGFVCWKIMSPKLRDVRIVIANAVLRSCGADIVSVPLRVESCDFATPAEIGRGCRIPPFKTGLRGPLFPADENL